MPRVRRPNALHLSDLLAAAVGAPLGADVAAGAVCEFSCSCCRSSTALAADALCTYLLTDQDAVDDFLYKADGMHALQTGLCSSNDAVVCACIRTSGALLHAMLVASQQPSSTRGECDDSMPDSHQQHDSSSPHASSWLTADGSTSSSSSSTLGGRVSVAQGVLTNLIAVAADQQHTADVRMAAFQELQQLMLLLAQDTADAGHALTEPKPSTRQPPEESSFAGLGDNSAGAVPIGSSSSRSECREPSRGGGSRGGDNRSDSTARTVLVEALTGAAQLQQVMQAAMHALADPHASLRRSASQALAAALVLQEASSVSAATAAAPPQPP